MITSGLVIAGCIVGGIFIMFPKHVVRRLAGHVELSDVGFSLYAINTGVATGTASGLLAGFVAAIGISVVLRYAVKPFMGSERLALDGQTEYRYLVAGLASQGIRWGKALWKAVWSKDHAVVPPEPLQWSWVTTSAGVDVRAWAKARWQALTTRLAGMF